jgi:hypothetical protein
MEEMIKKIAGNNMIQQAQIAEVPEIKPHPKVVKQSPAESESFTSSRAATEKKFTAAITETIVRSSLEGQLQANSAAYNPNNSAGKQVADTFSRMEEEYKKQQEAQKEAARLQAAVQQSESNPPRNDVQKATVEQNTSIIGRLLEPGSDDNEGQPSIPYNPSSNQVADMFGDMEAAYKKQQEEQKAAARLRAAVEIEKNPAQNEAQKARVEQNIPIITRVVEPGPDDSEAQPFVPYSPGSDPVVDMFADMEAAYKKQQEEQKEAARLRAAIVNQDLPDV